MYLLRSYYSYKRSEKMNEETGIECFAYNVPGIFWYDSFFTYMHKNNYTYKSRA